MAHHRAARSAGPGEPTAAPGPSRRSVLRYSALAAALGPALTACARDQPLGSGPAGAAGQLRIASPTNPVTWPIASDNPPIAAGLSPERDATLQVYNYADYLAPEAMKSFEKEVPHVQREGEGLDVQ